jgi:hypothetical protein
LVECHGIYIPFIFLSCVLRFSFLLTMLMCIDVQGQEDLCESFFAYNRAKGTLYDGETRLFLRGNGKHTRIMHVTHHCSTIDRRTHQALKN